MPQQTFKAIYFPDIKNSTTKSKSFTLAFSKGEKKIYDSVKYLSSLEMRKILSVKTFGELEKHAEDKKMPINRYCILKIHGELSNYKKHSEFNLDPAHTTFQGGKEMPLQNWFPYLEGYSPDFVKYIIDNYLDNAAKVIYDPFSGTGTTPMTASGLGYTAYYSEINPLLQFLTKTKSKARSLSDRKKIINLIESLLPTLRSDILRQTEDQELKKTYSQTFGKSKFFSDDVYGYILKTKTYINQIYFKDILVSELITVAVLSSLVECSLMKRQGDLRFRRGKELDELKNLDFFRTIFRRLNRIVEDLKIIKPCVAPTLITEDARAIGKLPPLGIDAVITSPPYLNGTNYFRNTKIELWFLGYLKHRDNLSNFRRLAVTAGINDVSQTIKKSIKNDLLEKLIVNLKKSSYDKRIPKMVHDYFADIDIIFSNLKHQLNNNAIVAIDLGDSIYGGVHVKTDKILISVLENLGYSFCKEVVLRKRQSNNGNELKQVLLIFKYVGIKTNSKNGYAWEKSWSEFKKIMPHHHGELAKRNWGDPIHSLCSFQGKLKPSIANQLVSIFVPSNGRILDLFGGVGTIPLESSIQNKNSFSFDISPAAVAISRAKIASISARKVNQVINNLEIAISKRHNLEKDLEQAAVFGLNKKLKDYFHPKTLEEIVLARKFFSKIGYETGEHALVMSAVMHILHGNRPYALSRRSHGITPFAPTGIFEYKNLIIKLREKIDRTINNIDRDGFLPGKVYFQDATKTWPTEIRELDAIITSPPFFDSTRFYAANWMRLWFAGWDSIHFKTEPVNFVDELQKKDLSIYENIFMQARERLKDGGVFVLHLGKSHKCDMAMSLSKLASRWFRIYDIFEESVEGGESHGIRDRGSVTKHQYLILT